MNWKQIQILLSLALAASLTAPAQTTSASKPKSTSTSGGDLFEINLFGGGVFTKRQKGAPNQDLVNGGVSGVRVIENLWNYVSLEQTAMVHGTTNLRYQIPGSFDTYALGARLRQFHFNPVLHFKPREARVRPFVTMGFGIDYFQITEAARRQVGNGVFTPFGQVTNLESQVRPAFNYGGGVKAKVTDRIGLRFDLRGFSTASPDFGVNPTGGPANAIRYTRTSPQNSLQATGGVTFYLGAIDQGPVCEFRVNSIEPATNTVWLGESASYKISTNNTCAGVTPKYKWMVDGQPVAGDELVGVKAAKVGETPIKVVVEADTSKVTDGKTRNFLKKFPIPATERTASLTVKQPVVELVSVEVDPATINYNGTAKVTSTLRYDGPASGPTAKLDYSSSGGTFDPASSTLTLRPGMNTAVTTFRPDPAAANLTPGGPTRTITLTSRGTDANGNSLGSKTAEIRIVPEPAPAPKPVEPPKLQPMQLDDVIFAKGLARTNNCGKRILDQAYERAVSMTDYDVLLVGHYDAVEKNIKIRDAKAKKSRSLDEERVRQVAAVLSAGTEPCKRLERSRIKVAYVGAEQLSPFKTSLCEATVKERASGKISPKDGNAKNRRVEIWLVPKSGPMPNGIAGITDAPAADIQSAGCPK